MEILQSMVKQQVLMKGNYQGWDLKRVPYVELVIENWKA